MSAAGWEIEKDVLYPGRVVVPGPDGRPLAYTFTSDDAHRLATTGNAQLGDGWHTPLAWEHQNVEPVRLSQTEKDREFARSVFGFAKGYRVDPADGRVKVKLAGDDPADLEQFRKLRFVSPEIQWDWRDSDGRVWRGPSITHIAATARPVQRHQNPVGAVRMSLRATSLEQLVRAVRVAPTIGALTPPHGRLRLSLGNYEAPPMADELDFGAGNSGTGDSGKGSAWERIAAALAGAGVQIGDGKNVKDPEHLADLIEVACMNSDQGMPEEDDLSDLDEEPDPNAAAGDMSQPPAGATATPMPPLQMSLTKQQEQAAGFARKNLGSRIDALEASRRVTPAIADELRAALPKLRLSFAANADLKPNALTVRLEAYERLPANSGWSPTDRKAGRAGVRLSRKHASVGRPSYEGDPDAGADTPAQSKKTIDAWNATGK